MNQLPADAAERLAALPHAAPQALALRINAAAVRHVRGGHPWLFDGSLVSINRAGAAGDIAVLFDEKRHFVAVGLYDPASPIRVKLLSHGRPVTIDGDFFAARIADALALRSGLASADTNAYRCINGENDGLPGLIVDRYADCLVLKLYTPIWLPHLAAVVTALLAQTTAKRIVLRLSRRMAAEPLYGLHDGMALVGDAPEQAVLFRENGLTFEADIVAGQKTGFFLDQRDNRALVGGLAAGRDVLDLFCYSGGFSLYAARGRARSVTSVDASAPALDAVRRNFALNAANPGVAACRHTPVTADVFDKFNIDAAADLRYDLVIVDPPAFAQKQADVPAALNAYAKLTRAALAVLQPGGTLVQASCSSRVGRDLFFSTVLTAARDAGRPLRELQRTGHAVDHPVRFAEGEYLKCLFATG